MLQKINQNLDINLVSPLDNFPLKNNNIRWNRFYSILCLHWPVQNMYFFIENFLHTIFFFKILNSFRLKRFTKGRFYVLRKYLNFTRRRQKRTQLIKNKLKVAGHSLRLTTWWRRRRLKKMYSIAFIKFFFLMQASCSVSGKTIDYAQSPALTQRVLPSLKLNKNFLKYLYFYCSTAEIKKYSANFGNFGMFSAIEGGKNIPFLHKVNTVINTSKNQISYLYVDANKSPLVLMRKAREVYNMLTIAKTLRNIRYKTFLKKELKFCNSPFFSNFKMTLLLRIYGFAFTWYQSILLIKYGIIWINGYLCIKNKALQEGDIFQFVCYKGLFLFITYTLKKYSRIKKKIKRAGYLRFMSYKKRWVTRKKNSVRFLEWFSSATISNNANVVYDHITQTGCILKLINHYSPTLNRDMLYSTVLKMSAWKFRAR